MGIRTAEPTEAPPDEWELDYEPCPCGDTAQRWFRDTKTFYHVPCEGAAGGRRLSWKCKMDHNRAEYAAGRDPIGKGGTPFRVSASEGWTQIGQAKENTDVARAEGKDLMRTTRT